MNTSASSLSGRHAFRYGVEFLRQTTHQGYRGDSCWSRGLTWALYGFTTCYEYSRDPHFLETAEACAAYYISHTASDGIPPWDFNAPVENRTLLDTSSAAICAAGLLRLAMAHPDRVTAIVSQNGNAYEEGLGDAWAPIRKYWSAPTPENRDILRKSVLTAGGTRWQYTHGVANPERVPPESYTLDTALL